MPLLRDVKDKLGSPYLVDHADNPVEWRTWDGDALAEAKRLDRPIFLSVGYAACHWCHVMAHESFEDPSIAKQLNDSFISIKVDREERPDVDALYMAATQLLSGHGGWPMSVFLLPDGRPFMAGTYYPPVDRHGQAGFPRLLDAMADAWLNQREVVVAQATQLQGALEREIAFVDHLGTHPDTHPDTLDLRATRQKLSDELASRVDAFGGFGDAPKFPRPSYIDALLDVNDDVARPAATRTLDAMSRRGLYDHIQGGFARYSVDAEWHVPHFEKMLSDQALLARTYLRAAKAIDGHPEWRDVALDTLRSVLSDFRVEQGYGCALDADANGVEGSHVTWTPAEVAQALEPFGLNRELERVLSRWSITSPGLFEGRSIPRLAEGEPFTTPPDLQDALHALREARGQRPQPARDQKVILEWNAMFASALLMSGAPVMIAEALVLLKSLGQSHFADGVWWRTEHHGAYATSSDVAWYVDALVDAFEATGSDGWLERAREASDFLLAHYWDGDLPSSRAPDSGAGVFTQCDMVKDLPAKPKEIFDGATPSSHAVACRALARLALCLGDNDLLAVSERLVDLAADLIATHPGAVPDLVAAAGFVREGIEIVIPGDANELSEHVRSLPMSRTVLITGNGTSALLAGRRAGLAYVCRSGVCQLPVATTAELDTQLRGSL